MERLSSDYQAEAIAMKAAMEYEECQEWRPEDVSANNEGYDIRSISPVALERYIEVKGRSGSDGSVMVSEKRNEPFSTFGGLCRLYIVMSCKSTIDLFRIQNPAKNLF